nr:extensin-like [Aegilops tauschii subsp. strangulata]
MAGVYHPWGPGNGRRGRGGGQDYPGPAAADQAGPSNPPAAVHHAYQTPPMPAFVAPPIDWAPADAATPFLGEDDFFDATQAPPPPGIFFGNDMDAGVAFCPVHGYGPCPARDFCPVHGYGPCPPPTATPPPEPEVIDEPLAYLDLPTPTPADEDDEHFAPPGYGPVLAMMEWEVTPNEEEEEWLNSVVKQEPTSPTETDEPGATIPDLNTATGVKIEDAASSSTAPASPPPPPPTSPRTPPPAARRILRRFTAVLEQHRPGLRSDSWAPAGLHLPGYARGGGGVLLLRIADAGHHRRLPVGSRGVAVGMGVIVTPNM